MRGEFLDLDGARLYYYAAGTRGAGEPVVFIHGFPASGHLWNEVVPLMPPGHRLVVVDLLGYGRSDRPMRRAVDVREHAERLIALLDELRIHSACIAGHGMGGGVAQSLAVRHADRVTRLCLLDSVAFEHGRTLETRLARAVAPLSRLLPPAVLRGVVRREIQRGYTDPERAARSIELYLLPFGDSVGRDALAAHLRALLIGETKVIADQLPSITVPTAIVWGQRDRIVPLAIGRRLAAAIDGATLEIIPSVSHFTPEEAPRQVADVLAELLTRA